ncbi:MAG: transcriptional regulator, putative ATPase, winged helix family, partial [Nocardioidaceae bacterium]|nr:transcriptional regulator, putative ATPase, winged helix family [Nocardioidaceae bacterium]
MRIRVTSALTVERLGRVLDRRELGSRKARTLLALLAAERGRLVQVDRIVEALWPGAPPRNPPANVATLASRLRRLLGTDVVTSVGRGYGLLEGTAWVVDLDEANALCDEATARLADGELGVAAAAARRALSLLGTDTALADQDEARWVLGVRLETDGLRRRARHLLSRAAATFDGAEAVQVATQAVEADPYDERALRDLMRSLAADGRTSAALAAYDGLAARLRDDLGTDPDPSTDAVRLAILRGEPLPEDRTRPSPRPRPALLGREDELGVLDAAWRQACSGRG